jgi:RNA polymerase sigma-70 factor (ECF subfamily)
MELEQATDEVLMFEYQNGNFLAFNILYERHYKKVFSYLRRKLKNTEVADDLFQQVFTKLHNSRSTYSNKFLFTQWLFVIIRTVLLDYWKMEKSRKVKISNYERDQNFEFSQFQMQTFANLDVTSSDQDFSQHVKGELHQLSPSQKLALELRFFDELSYDEIALRLQVSPAGVRKLVSRGIKILRDKLLIPFADKKKIEDSRKKCKALFVVEPTIE